MRQWVIYLRPKSSVTTWLSSDTLFGALFWALRQIEGDNAVARWLKQCCADEPPLVLSSAFPFVEGNPPLHFFPKPLTLTITAAICAEFAGGDRGKLLKGVKLAKKANKATYLSEQLFAEALQGKLTADELLKRVAEEGCTLWGRCLCLVEEQEELSEHLWVEADIQHTAVDRLLTSAAERLLFFDTELFFGKRVGLFFFLRCPDEFPLEAILRYWRYSGIGGNRSTGKGWFDPFAWKDAQEWLKRLTPSGGNAILLLSRCLPKGGEFDSNQSRYRLVTARPKFEFAFRQPSRVYKGILRFVAEGSVLVPKEFKDAYGQLLCVGQQQDESGNTHPVYHNGFGFPLRMVMPNALA